MSPLTDAESQDRVVAVLSCERLIHQFAWHLDQGSPATEIAALFAEDGIWELPTHGLRSEGRAELARYFGSFSPRSPHAGCVPTSWSMSSARMKREGRRTSRPSASTVRRPATDLRRLPP